jgi:carbonic anhydrase/acetyltransferase-like protein (isoleucine patch superfamily)
MSLRQPCLLRVGEAFVADNATVVGAVRLDAGVSVWYGTVIRGDVAAIHIGRATNVQDLSVVHPQHDEDIEVGEEVTIGHGVMVHGRRVGRRSLIGMGAILLPGSVVGEECIVGAGALVTLRMHIPDRSVVMGAPARVVRAVSDRELAGLIESCRRYEELSRRHLREGAGSLGIPEGRTP